MIRAFGHNEKPVTLAQRMPTDDYLADYALLGLQPGCSMETLERTWRLAVRDLHPDRAHDSPDIEARNRRLHELTGAYRRLRQFGREHGRLPGGMLRPSESAAAAASAAAQPKGSEADARFGSGIGAATLSRSSPSMRGRWQGYALAAAVAMSVVWALTPSHDEAARQGHEAARALEPPATPTRSVNAASPTRRIRVGSTEAQVERLIGSPMVSAPDVWEYGPSHVRFERGRVVGWYSSPLKPLPVDVESR